MTVHLLVMNMHENASPRTSLDHLVLAAKSNDGRERELRVQVGVDHLHAALRPFAVDLEAKC